MEILWIGKLEKVVIISQMERGWKKFKPVLTRKSIQHLTWTKISICLEASKQEKSLVSNAANWNWSDFEIPPNKKTNGKGFLHIFNPSPNQPQPHHRKGSTRRPCQQRGELTPDPGAWFCRRDPVISVRRFENQRPSWNSKQIVLNGWK